MTEDTKITKNPLVVLLLSVAVFLGGDFVVFRSGFYPQYQNISTVAGMFWNRVQYITEPTSDPRPEVLVVGHSKIEAALSLRQYEREFPDSPFHFRYGSASGSTPKIWYYLFRTVDKDRNRFAAIVIPLDEYYVQPIQTDEENQFQPALTLAPFLSPADWVDLAGTYTKDDVRAKVWRVALFASRRYPEDVQDLLLHPRQRMADLKWLHANGPTYLYDWSGYDGDLTDLQVDLDKGKIVHAPSHLDWFRRGEMEGAMRAVSQQEARENTLRYSAFMHKWLGRIVDYYRGSATRIVFLRVPRWPIPWPGLTPISGAEFIPDWFKDRPNVYFLDKEIFADLEKPMYFYDSLHMNKDGRAIFTTRFGEKIEQIFPGGIDIGTMPPLAGHSFALGSATADPGMRLPADGWSWPEGAGRWAVGRASRIVFRGRPGPGDLTMTLDHAYSLRGLEVTVSVNGEQLGTFSNADPATLSIDIPARLVRENAPLVVTFGDAGNASPKSLGLSGEDRDLAFWLGAVTFTEKGGTEKGRQNPAPVNQKQLPPVK